MFARSCPFVFHDKLIPDIDAPFFESAGNAMFRSDRVGWLRRLFDLSCAEYERLNLDKDDAVLALTTQFDERPGWTERERYATAAVPYRTHRERADQGRSCTVTYTTTCSS